MAAKRGEILVMPEAASEGEEVRHQPVEHHTFAFARIWSPWCGWCPVSLWDPCFGRAPGCRLRLQPPLQWGIAAAEEPRGHRCAPADHRACGSTGTLYSYTCYTQRVHNFFSINSDSFHTLNSEPHQELKSESQCWEHDETHDSSSCHCFSYFSSINTSINF